MKGAAITIVFALAATFAAQPALAQAQRPGAAQAPVRLPDHPPLPPPRPRVVAPEVPAPSGAGPQESSCLSLLEQRGAEFAPAPQAASAGEACAIDEAVSFRGVRLADGGTIRLDSAVIVRCALAAELAAWLRDDLASIARRHALEVRALVGVGGQECRSRNRQSGARISEHAAGNAFDVHRLQLAGGETLDLMQDRSEARRAFREDIRASACARFPTVLGTGSDGYHEDHLHVDLRERRGGYRLCQWDVK